MNGLSCEKVYLLQFQANINDILRFKDNVHWTLFNCSSFVLNFSVYFTRFGLLFGIFIVSLLFVERNVRSVKKRLKISKRLRKMFEMTPDFHFSTHISSFALNTFEIGYFASKNGKNQLDFYLNIFFRRIGDFTRLFCEKKLLLL